MSEYGKIGNIIINKNTKEIRYRISPTVLDPETFNPRCKVSKIRDWKPGDDFEIIEIDQLIPMGEWLEIPNPLELAKWKIKNE